MAKATEVQSDDECDENNNENESESDDDDDEPTKHKLFDMLEDAKTHFDIKRRECKDLCKELKALKQAFDELNASHERLEEAHEKLGKAHKKLEKAYSTLVEQTEKEPIVTCDKGLTCDMIDKSFYKPIVVAPTNPSCSTSTSTSSSSDGFTCDACWCLLIQTDKSTSVRIPLYFSPRSIPRYQFPRGTRSVLIKGEDRPRVKIDVFLWAERNYLRFL
jgi:hypothetical protein